MLEVLLGNWKVSAAALALGLFVGATGTWRVMSWKEGAQQTATVEKKYELTVKGDAITYQVGLDFSKLNTADLAHHEAVLEDLHVHVTPEIDRDFPVPCAFVRVFNDAWHGPVPEPAVCPDGAPSEVDFTRLGTAEAGNGTNYDVVSDRLTSLQEWIRQQQALRAKQ